MILVTGATGFIGRAVVARLLATHDAVTVLARPLDGRQARARVAAVLDGAAVARVHVIEGDLAAPGCGLAADDLGRVLTTIDTVVHCAGDTTFFPEAMAPYVAGHVDGPAALLRALARGRLTRWAHVSTAFVCGDRGGVVQEREGDVGQGFHNPYERVKLRAETAIRAAASETGVDVRVLRPSIVYGTAPATAGGNPSNVLFAFIRLAAVLAQWPEGADTPLRFESAPRAPFNIVPLDYVAAAIAALAEHPDAAGGAFHLVVRDAPSQASMLAILVERLGLRRLTMLDAITEPLTDASPLERRVARMLEVYRPYLIQDVRFDDTAAATVLARCGIALPTLAPPDVHRLIDLALGTDAPEAYTTSSVREVVSPKRPSA